MADKKVLDIGKVAKIVFFEEKCYFKIGHFWSMEEIISINEEKKGVIDETLTSAFSFIFLL